MVKSKINVDLPFLCGQKSQEAVFMTGEYRTQVHTG